DRMRVLAEIATFVFTRLSFSRKGFLDAMTFVAVLAFCLVLEWRKERSLRRYGTRGFRTDLLYAFVYLSGIYSLLVGLPVYRFLTTRLTQWVPSLQTHALTHVPAPLQFILGLAIADLTYYFW